MFSSDEIFIVTGASSGIGKAVAQKLVEYGAKVLGIARSEDKLLKAKSESSFPDNFEVEVQDLNLHLEDMQTYLKSLKDKYGKFSGIACCAGSILLKPAAATEYVDSVNLFKTNYFAPVMMIKNFMDKRICIGRGASAVAIASAEAFLREKGICIYSGTKAALQATLSTIAKEIANKGMRINTVSPTDIKTPMTMNEQMLAARADRESTYPMGFGEPVDVAEMVAFLLSKKAKWITGHDYIVDCATF